jgi:cell wall-associated NlpC family hydrolase
MAHKDPLQPIEEVRRRPGPVPADFDRLAQQTRVARGEGTARRDEQGAAPAGGPDLSLLDQSELSPKAREELEKQKAEEARKAEEEQLQREEIERQIRELQQKLDEQLKRGDLAGARETMNQLIRLLEENGAQAPPDNSIPAPQTSGGPQPGYNAPGNYAPVYGGDAPAFYPPVAGQPRDGGPGARPQDIPAIAANLPDAGDRQGIVNTALQIAGQGLPYVWGGDGPQEGGYDCSGFTKAVYGKNGINIPRTAQTQYDYCKAQGTLFTDISQAKPGDLIFFDNPYSKKTSPVGHVMIYLGNGKMVGAQSDGVKVYDYNDYWKKYTVGFGRPR